MKITSSDFNHGDNIPAKFTCDGENINPALTFHDVPDNTESLVLIMEDPDVPTLIREDGMWDHWLIWNIPPETKAIPANSQPKGVCGLTTSNRLTYGGPCPPDKEHRYFFKLYALDTILDLKAGATKAELIDVMKDNILAEAELVGKYDRNQSS